MPPKKEKRRECFPTHYTRPVLPWYQHQPTILKENCRQISLRNINTRSVESISLSVLSVIPWTTRLLPPWDFPGKNTAVGCHFLFQGIFPTQESNRGLLHSRQTLYHLNYQGSTKVFYKHTSLKQNTSKPNPVICQKDYKPWPNGIYPKNAKMV